MKLFLFFILSLIIHQAQSQNINGNWQGALHVQGTELPIIFHIKKDSVGKLSATFDSPKQKAYNLPCTEVLLRNDSIIIMIKAINGKYEGLLGENKKILSGKWFQGANSLPLDLKKTSDSVTIKERKRPQTPKPPFNYASEEVTYFNTDKSIQFGATITYPFSNSNTKFPAVILITGSGKQDRDETIFDHKPFAVIADYFTRKGIVVIRVDDRGTGKTNGNYNTSTTADFAKDVEAGIIYLKTLKQVDTNNIGLIGHSEGGIIAPMLAGNRRDIKFIVMLAGPAVKIVDLMQQQAMDVISTSGVSKPAVEQYGQLYKNMVTAILKEKDTTIARENANAVFTYWQQKNSSDIVKATTGVTDDKSRDEFVKLFVGQLQSPWFNYFMKLDPADYLKKVKCHVLALNGEKDIQVSAVNNIASINKILPVSKPASFKTQIMPGLNHLFQHCKSCTVDEYEENEETFSTEVLQIVGDWIDSVVKK